MQSALALLVCLGWIEIIPFVRQVMLLKIGLHLGIGQIEYWADLERRKIRVFGNDVQSGAVGILTFPQRSNPDFGRQFPHPTPERFEFHYRAELLERRFVLRCWNRPVKSVAMGGRNLRHKSLQV